MVWAAIGAATIGAAGAYASSKNSSKAMDRATDANMAQAQIAQDQWDTYKETYQPLEKSMVAEAQNYDTPEAYDKAAGLAQATVSEQFGKEREQLGRTPGMDPSSGAYISALAGLDRSQAAVDATQQNAARTQVQNTAWARKTDAVSLGKGLAANASTGMAQVGQNAAGLASTQAKQANDTATGLGNLAGNVFNAWNKSNSTPAPGLTPTQQQGYTEFASGYTPENYG